MQTWTLRFLLTTGLAIALSGVANSQPPAPGSIEEKVQQTVTAHLQFIEGHQAHCLDDQSLSEPDSAALQAAEQLRNPLHTKVFIGADSAGFRLRQGDPLRMQMLICMRLKHSLMELTLLSHDDRSGAQRAQEIQQKMSDLKRAATQMQQQAQAQPDISDAEREAMLEQLVKLDTQYGTLRKELGNLTALSSIDIQEALLTPAQKTEMEAAHRATDERLALLEQRSTAALQAHDERCRSLAVETRDQRPLQDWRRCMASKEYGNDRDQMARDIKRTDIHPDLYKDYKKEMAKAGLQCAETSKLMARFDAFYTQCAGESVYDFLPEQAMVEGKDCHAGLLDHQVCAYNLLESWALTR